MNEFYALDLETAPKAGYPQLYALQPWRVREGTARITSVAVGKDNGQTRVTQHEIEMYLIDLAGKTVFTWNGMFDVAWLLAAGFGHHVAKINWVDGMLFWKWYANSEVSESHTWKWNLAAGAKHWLKDWEHCAWFVDMKKNEPEAGVDDMYWETRAKWDAVVTAMIAKKIWFALDDKRRNSALIEAKCILPMALSWINGVPMDFAKIQQAVPVMTTEMDAIEQRLGFKTSGSLPTQDSWEPSKILGSPKQLADVLYNHWGLPINEKFRSEKTGDPSSSKAALTYLADYKPEVLDIMRWRELNTRLSKFIKSPLKARDYLQSDVMHPSPKLFSTYTGRLTYSSKVKLIEPVGMALHQMPRAPEVRQLIVPPSGYELVEFDAAGQEDQIMAAKSGDENLKRIFNTGMDVHSFTAASIAGQTYEQIMARKKAKDETIVGAQGLRMAGKVTNHSNKYRIGPSAMMIMARVQYGIECGMTQAKMWQNSFHRSFPGIKQYWKTAMASARELGYAETIGGRRYGIPMRFFENKDIRWHADSAAINFPIQGTGADMKELAISVVAQKYPELIFAFDLHDGLFYWAPIGTPVELYMEVKHTLDNLDYFAAWGWDKCVPLDWDGEVGPSWGDMVDIKERLAA